jgi:hypothetical protein
MPYIMTSAGPLLDFSSTNFQLQLDYGMWQEKKDGSETTI